MNVADTYTIPYGPAECVQGGMRLAEFVGAAYRPLDPDGVIAAGGSVGRGDADRYSDLEILAFWPHRPTPQARVKVVAGLGAELWTMDRDGETMEHFGFGELRLGGATVDGTSMVSVSHYTFVEVETAIHRVFTDLSTDPEDHAFLAMIRDAVPLVNAPVFDAWRERLSRLPEALVRKIVRENLDFGPWFIPQALAVRGDRLALHAHMHTVERCLLRVHAALGGSLVAFPSGKWARRAVSPNMRQRLDECYGTDLSAGWSAMYDLMMETISLVQDRFGDGLKTEDGQSLCDGARKRWDPLPPYTLMLATSREIVGASDENSTCA